jgi:DNA polymerase V
MDSSLALSVPLQSSPVRAGFPSPAEDYVEDRLDFNRRLIRNPAATYCIRVSGDSMRDAGILSGDILVVDRSLKARDGDVVVASLDGSFTVKGFKAKGGRVFLVPANPDFTTTEVTGREDFQLFGVVAHLVRSLRGNGEDRDLPR